MVLEDDDDDPPAPVAEFDPDDPEEDERDADHDAGLFEPFSGTPRANGGAEWALLASAPAAMAAGP